MADGSEAPSRPDVEAIWYDLIAGTVTREAVHAWTVRWVEDRWEEVSDGLVESGLQALHGFDLTYDLGRPNLVRHGPGDCHVHSDDDVRESFNRWMACCELRDRDPERYAQSVRDQVERLVRTRNESRV